MKGSGHAIWILQTSIARSQTRPTSQTTKCSVALHDLRHLWSASGCGCVGGQLGKLQRCRDALPCEASRTFLPFFLSIHSLREDRDCGGWWTGLSSSRLFEKKRDMVVAWGFAVAKHANLSFLQLNVKIISGTSTAVVMRVSSISGLRVHSSLTRNYRQESLIKSNDHGGLPKH